MSLYDIFILKLHIFPSMLLMGWQNSLKYKRSVLILWMKQAHYIKKKNYEKSAFLSAWIPVKILYWSVCAPVHAPCKKIKGKTAFFCQREFKVWGIYELRNILFFPKLKGWCFEAFIFFGISGWPQYRCQYWRGWWRGISTMVSWSQDGWTSERSERLGIQHFGLPGIKMT